MDYSKPILDSTDKMLHQLPKERFRDGIDLYKWEGFWFRPRILEAAQAFQSQFQARNDDVILASSMKTGTTWLKALLTSIVLQGSSPVVEYDEHGKDDLLVRNHPAIYVQTMEVQVYTSNPLPDLSGLQSPRVFHTHVPYNVLPDSVKNSECKIVYITRNPKDTVVSLWHFFNNLAPDPLEKTFESFCSGVSPFGPFFDHVLQYWEESIKRPNKILFMKYEELKRDPRGQVKRLASFLGRPFGKEEEVDNVLERCSLKRLKDLEVNKSGVDPWVGIPNSSYFRLGIVGDWKNNFTPEMANRLDQLTQMKLEGSGLEL